jgi:hypothetical protein
MLRLQARLFQLRLFGAFDQLTHLDAGERLVNDNVVCSMNCTQLRRMVTT